jgi:hypothetical protein
VRLFSFAIPRDEADPRVTLDGGSVAVTAGPGYPLDPAGPERPAEPPPPAATECVELPLIRLAFARSGDKGNRANIGIVPRRPEYLPWLWRALTPESVAARFRHYLQGPVERYFLPGTGAINFVLHEVLGGGGVASLRNDPQGKAYGQILLAMPIEIPADLAPEAP